jgi:hypothetical protein
MTFPPSGAPAPTDAIQASPRDFGRASAQEPVLDPAQARLHAKMRRLMMISGFATVLGIAVVIGIIGYRVFGGVGSVADVTALLPKGAKVVSTTIAGDRIAVVIDAGGTVEVRTFDLRTLRPAGKLKFAAEP